MDTDQNLLSKRLNQEARLDRDKLIQNQHHCTAMGIDGGFCWRNPQIALHPFLKWTHYGTNINSLSNI